MKAILRLLVALLFILSQAAGMAAGPGDYPVHTQMPMVPVSVADYQSMWDPFVLRLDNGAPLEVRAEAVAETRTMAGYDNLPWNGRQVARDPAGNWLVLVEKGDGSGTIYLAVGPGCNAANPGRNTAIDYRPRGGDLPAFELVGPGERTVIKQGGGGSRASMVVDGQRRLHVIFHRADGLWQLHAPLTERSPGDLRERDSWTGPVRVVEGPCRAGDLMRDASGRAVICYAQDDRVYYRDLAAAEPEEVLGANSGLQPLRQFAPVANVPVDDAAAPGLGKLRRIGGRIPQKECESQDAVMDVALDGTVWLVFRRDFALYAASRSPNGKWSVPERMAREYAYHPSIIVANGRPLVVWQHDGLHRQPLDPGTNLRQREGGAPTLGYATLTDLGWRLGTLAKPEEIAIFRRGMWAQRGTGRQHTQMEQFGWPVLFRDGQGVVWALWQNATRRWSYRARWQGDGFGDVQECRGPFNAPRLPVNAEKLVPPGATDAGLLFHAAAAGGRERVIFDRLHVPSLATTDAREVLFLDGLEIAESRGVELRLNPMTKPISEPALSPRNGERTAMNASVSKRGDLYAMTYSRSFEGGAAGPGFAISRDGLRFETVDAFPDGLPDPVRGPFRPLSFWSGIESSRPKPFYTHPDPAAPASHKFMRLAFTVEARGSYWLEHSPDGKQWTRALALTAPEVMRERAQPNLHIADDPERPLRIYSRVYTETGRSWGVIWSHDLERWSGMEHLLDVDDPYGKPPAMDHIGTTGKDYTMRGQIFLDAVAGKNEDEIYAASVRKAEGLYFCFYWPGQLGRPLSDIGIAVSRDGFNFCRVKNGERILPLGPPGAWDSGYIFQMNPMLEPGSDTIRVYYRATAGRREGTDGFEHNLTEVGVAEIRANGFTYFSPATASISASANVSASGSVTTIPIESLAGAKKRLAVNVGGLDTSAASFAVEVLDAATDRPLPGFTAADCLPLASEGIAAPVRWRDNIHLPEGKPIRLRFHLRGQDLRFYSFGYQ